MQGSGSKDQGYYFAGQNIPLQLDNLKHYSAWFLTSNETRNYFFS